MHVHRRSLATGAVQEPRPSHFKIAAKLNFLFDMAFPRFTTFHVLFLSPLFLEEYLKYDFFYDFC